MSFRSATKDLVRSYTFTNLELNGGYDCNILFPWKAVDLLVHGGATILKCLCVHGNIYVDDFLIGDVCGNIFTQQISEKEPTQGIQIIGNIDMQCYDISNVMNLYVQTVHGKASPWDSADDMNMLNGNAVTWEQGIRIGSTSTVTSSVSSIAIGKGAVSSNIHTIAVGGLSIASNLYSTAIGYNTTSSHDRAIVIGSNSSSTEPDDIVLGDPSPSSPTATATAWGQVFSDRGWVGGGITGALIDNDGNFIRGNSGNGGIVGNLDMKCYYISNVMGLQVDHITSKGLDVGTLVDVVSFDSPPIINVPTTGGGIQNQFWGYQNGIAVTTGTRNTSQGYRSLASVTTGSRNVSIGNECMELAVGVNDCIAIGHRAGEAIATTSRQSIIIGSYAGRQIGTSSNRTYGSVIIGHRSLESCTERAICNTFIGSQTGLQVTASGFANTAIGYQAIQYGLQSPVSALGNYNIAIGYKSMTYGTTGQGSVAIGFFALRGNTNWNRIGQFQIGIGNQAGAYANSDYTIAIGMAALRGATSTTTTGFTSPRSIAIGYQAMLRARSGSDDAIAIGANALIDCRGTYNIGIGRDTGSTITIGYENILIGHNADVGSGFTLGGIAMGYNTSVRSYSVVIGHNSQGYHYSSIVIGHGATSSGIDTITFGRPIPTNASATATAWGQTFCDRAWVGGGVTGAIIDNGGNIIRGNTGGGNISATFGLTVTGNNTINYTPSVARTTLIAAFDTTLYVSPTYLVPAGYYTAGTTFRIIGYGGFTSGSVSAWNLSIKIGSTGTTADSTAISLSGTPAGSGVQIPFIFTGYFTIRNSTDLASFAQVINQGTTGILTTTAIQTQTQITLGAPIPEPFYVGLTANSGSLSNTCTFQNIIVSLV